MQRLFLAALLGLGLLSVVGGAHSAFARSGAADHGASGQASVPARALPVRHDDYRRYVPPPHHGYRPAPRSYHQSYYHPRHPSRYDYDRRDYRGWR